MPEPVKLPTSVKIGGWVYTIEPMPELEYRASGSRGAFSTTRNLIQIEVGGGYKKAASTLLHEILHGVLYHFGHKEEDLNERLIEVIEEGLVAIWVDNPLVMHWIAEGLLGLRAGLPPGSLIPMEKIE